MLVVKAKVRLLQDASLLGKLERDGHVAPELRVQLDCLEQMVTELEVQLASLTLSSDLWSGSEEAPDIRH